jgi:hypothetical protein
MLSVESTWSKCPTCRPRSRLSSPAYQTRTSPANKPPIMAILFNAASTPPPLVFEATAALALAAALLAELGKAALEAPATAEVEEAAIEEDMEGGEEEEEAMGAERAEEEAEGRTAEEFEPGEAVG